MSRRKNPPSSNFRGNNAGGFGNPPVRHQFKPGGKGGPGRPKGMTSADAALRKMFASTVQVSQNGEIREMHMTEAIVERLKKEILTGSPRLLEMALELVKKYGPVDQVDDAYVLDFSEFTAEQRVWLRDVFNGVEYIDKHELRRLQQLDCRAKKPKSQ
ncbi:DUF5681 domain-containing protein [Parasphingorhabdus sp.]|uniref:DUF5681 domain-containing protein n=1 Tax=Parasphingorhabdus sp. TaxID=2709688 RepID=UPI00300115DB